MGNSLRLPSIRQEMKHAVTKGRQEAMKHLRGVLSTNHVYSTFNHNRNIDSASLTAHRVITASSPKTKELLCTSAAAPLRLQLPFRHKKNLDCPKITCALHKESISAALVPNQFQNCFAGRKIAICARGSP